MNAEEKESGTGLPGDVAESGGDVGPARVPSEGEDRIARSGHDLGRGAATDLAGIFAEGDIADVMESVLDASPRRQLEMDMATMRNDHGSRPSIRMTRGFGLAFSY